MGFGQTTHQVTINVVATDATAATQVAKLLEHLGAKADRESLQILAEVADKPKINEKLKRHKGLLKRL